jgi:acyl-CoA reductase-like NAD-dependent aldehyde dehydrogenase
MRGVYQNAGQNCIGIERVLVEKPVYQAFVVEMEKRVKALRQSAPLGFGLGDEQADVGAMVLPASLGRIQELVDDAVKKGARLLVGGKRYEHPRWPKVGWLALRVVWFRLTANLQLFRANTTRRRCLLMLLQR